MDTLFGTWMSVQDHCFLSVVVKAGFNQPDQGVPYTRVTGGRAGTFGKATDQQQKFPFIHDPNFHFQNALSGTKIRDKENMS
jgi:hypothetical protein